MMRLNELVKLTGIDPNEMLHWGELLVVRNLKRIEADAVVLDAQRGAGRDESADDG